MRDLEPLVCIFAPCSLTFNTSDGWMNHMRKAHGTYLWVCHAPSHDPIRFKQEVEFQHHAQEVHDVPQVYLENVSSAACRLLEQVGECPFGDECPPVANKGYDTTFTDEALYLHVVAHMEEIALLALHKLPNGGGEHQQCTTGRWSWWHRWWHR